MKVGDKFRFGIGTYTIQKIQSRWVEARDSLGCGTTFSLDFESNPKFNGWLTQSSQQAPAQQQYYTPIVGDTFYKDDGFGAVNTCVVLSLNNMHNTVKFIDGGTGFTDEVVLPLDSIKWFRGWKDQRALPKTSMHVSATQAQVGLAAAQAGMVDAWSGNFAWPQADERVFGKNDLFKPACNHKWAKYDSGWRSFQYCELCDLKKEQAS